jgi:hypothetical protein
LTGVRKHREFPHSRVSIGHRVRVDDNVPRAGIVVGVEVGANYVIVERPVGGAAACGEGRRRLEGVLVALELDQEELAVAGWRADLGISHRRHPDDKPKDGVRMLIAEDPLCRADRGPPGDIVACLPLSLKVKVKLDSHTLKYGYNALLHRHFHFRRGKECLLRWRTN